MIRNATESDREHVIGLWESTGLTRPSHDTIEEFDSAINNVMSEIFVAEEDYIIRGTAMCGFDGRRGWVYRLAVEPSSQAKGIGSALLAHCESWLASIGAPKVMLMIREDNARVKGFYEAAGYEDQETIVMGKVLK